jgi:hypothetical protein
VPMNKASFSPPWRTQHEITLLGGKCREMGVGLGAVGVGGSV